MLDCLAPTEAAIPSWVSPASRSSRRSSFQSIGLDYGSSHMASPIYFAYEWASVANMATIGERIRDTRKALHLRQGDLAESAGVDQSTISDIERGKGFGADVLMRLCAALHTDPYFLMLGEVNAHASEMRLLSLFRACSDADKTIVMESAAAFASRNQQPTAPAAAYKSKGILPHSPSTQKPGKTRKAG